MSVRPCHVIYVMLCYLFCFVDFIGNSCYIHTYTKLNRQRSKRTEKKEARLPKGRGTNGTQGPMQGTLPEFLKVIIK